jgi:hypothetical protein
MNNYRILIDLISGRPLIFKCDKKDETPFLHVSPAVVSLPRENAEVQVNVQSNTDWIIE